jgi:beta-lactamase regulating signal transducer with metallopeptidase domain
MTAIALVVIKASVILVVASLTVTVATRVRAAIRHLILAAAFLALLILPVAIRVLPEQPLPFRISAVETAEPLYVTHPLDTPRPLAEHSRIVSAATPPSWHLWPLGTLLTLIWAAGAVIALLPLAVGRRALRQLRREAIDWRTGDSLLRELIGGRRPVRAVSVSLHRAVTGPMTFGVLRPVIVFPPDAVEWRTADLRRALRHELEHVRRADCLIDAVARVTCALYWFHPLAWLSWHRLRLEAERACDDAVVRESEAVAYAEQLVSLAARVSTTHAPLLAMTAVGAT